MDKKILKSAQKSDINNCMITGKLHLRRKISNSYEAPWWDFWSTILMLMLVQLLSGLAQNIFYHLKSKLLYFMLDRNLHSGFTTGSFWAENASTVSNREYLLFQVDAPRERETVWLDWSKICAVPDCCKESCPAAFLTLVSYCWYTVERRPDPEWFVRCYKWNIAKYGALFLIINIMKCFSNKENKQFLQLVRHLSIVDCINCVFVFVAV